MIWLRCPLQLLLLLVAASVVNGDPSIDHWIHCGITQLCIVHNSCFGSSASDKAWRAFTSLSFTDPHQITSFNYKCQRFITIEPLVGASEAKITMRDNTMLRSQGLRLFFKNVNGVRPRIACGNHAEGEETTESIYLKILKSSGSTDAHVYCIINIGFPDSTDIREKITKAAGGKFIVAGERDSLDNPVEYTVDATLINLKILCEGTILTGAWPSLDVSSEELPPDYKSFPKKPSDVPEYTETVKKYGGEALDDESSNVVCPAGYVMLLKKKDGSEFNFVKDGLKCNRGLLEADVKTKTGSEKVTKEYSTKCARRKCTTCSPPTLHHLKGASSPPPESPLFDPAEEGDRCRTLTCPKYMVVKLKGKELEPIMYKSTTLSCSKDNVKIEGQIWDVETEKGELIEATCTNGVYCTKMYPLNVGTCKEGDNDCREPTILDTYIGGKGTVCYEDFDLIYITPGSGNRQTLHAATFGCNPTTGKWKANDKQNVEVTIPANATLLCRRREKYIVTTTEMPFLAAFRLNGSLWPLYLFGAGIFLVVVAVIVGGIVCIIVTKKKKAAKRKAMESVSVTFKPPPKRGKRKKDSDRKKRQVSVVNSVTGTNSGPNSQSGSAPIAPPSRLYDPAKGVAKPDKGCAVLDLTTGQSKNLRWTNHAGDGPPTQKRESGAASNSNQEDIQSAIKFAPGEVEALRQAGRGVPRKQKSRQNSIEYNFGDPKPVKNEDEKRVTRNWASSDVPANQDESKRVEGDESTIKQ